MNKRRRTVREQILNQLLAEKGVNLSEFRQQNIRKAQYALIEQKEPKNADFINCVNQFYEDQLINEELKRVLLQKKPFERKEG